MSETEQTQFAARPFTSEELDSEISGLETAFRIYLRGARAAHLEKRHSDADRLHTYAAETAAILAELRYQRGRTC